MVLKHRILMQEPSCTLQISVQKYHMDVINADGSVDVLVLHHYDSHL